MESKNILVPKLGIVLAGIIFGTLGALAVNWGNPPNMGLCVACFIRDIAGAIQLHHNPLAQYIRPEILGMILGAWTTAIACREWHTRGGASPLIRFLLGICVMIGVLVFLGCPIRVMLRLAGGDLNGLIALIGMVVGILCGIFFLKRGFSLGEACDRPHPLGMITPLVAVGLLLLLITKPSFIIFSQAGTGSQHLPGLLGLGLGLIVGFLVQKSRFCSIGAWRDLFLVKDYHLLSGVIAFGLAAVSTNYLVGNFSPEGLGYHWGFQGQPIALPMTTFSQYLLTFLSLGLVGLAGTLLDGCPLRTLIRSGEGDTDAAVTVLGYLTGAAIAHNLPIASSPNGLGNWGAIAIGLGWCFCLTVAFLRCEGNAKAKATAFVGDGLITFGNVQSAMRAEKAIQTAGYLVKLVAPPPNLRMGCDLALEINLVEKPGIERLLQENQFKDAQIVPITEGTSAMCNIVKVTDFGNWFMVKSGNMKLSFEKGSGLIVNISGGGCPDIPYLHAEMVDQPLPNAPQPRDLGYTLCATMLQRAYEESLSLEGGQL